MDSNLEQRVNKLEQRQDMVEIKLDAISEKLDMNLEIGRARDAEFRESIRRHEAEMRQMRADFSDAINKLDAKFESKFEKMDNKMDSLSRYVQNLTLTAMVGIGGITVAVIAFVASYIVRTAP